LATTTATLDQLTDISASFKSIDAQTTIFSEKSSGILFQQRRNEQHVDAISENLQYYEPLERFHRRLNAPGAGSFVRSTAFSDMLITLDECIDYMQTHPKHKEAETYRSRYKLLLTRSLTLVRNAFMNGVREITTEVTKRIADQQLNDTTMSTLLYAKFRVGAAEMKQLGLEIRKRANPAADAEPGTEGEYQSLMNELHTTFATSRGRLILPLIHKRLAEIGQAPSSKDLDAFALACISYIRGMCMDEFELWGEWFHGQKGLYTLLDSICEPVYDALRPRIIHDNFQNLCLLVTSLQDRYFGEDDDSPPNLNDLDFPSLLEPVLEDAQSQLVFRAQSVITKDIERYKPTANDLAWPKTTSSVNTTSDATSISRVSRQNTNNSGNWATRAVTSITSSSKSGTVYPTLPKAISLLSSIYRLIHSSVFDDLAHEIVHQTTISLSQASTLIKPLPGITTSLPQIDGQLFLLRHLLLLKSQIVLFDIESHVTPDVSFDFSALLNTFFEIRERGGLFNPRAWYRLMQRPGGLMPRVVENMLDAKVELDGRLRTVISEYVGSEVAELTAELPASAPSKESGGQSTSTNLGELTLKRVESEVPLMRAKLEQYIDDFRTRETLVAAVLEQVVQAYETYLEQVVGQTKISRKGKGKEGSIWDVETFEERVARVFSVQLPDVEAEDGLDSENGSRRGSRSLSRSGSS
jgi:conserved oligomeric Golgi complex subunit 3